MALLFTDDLFPFFFLTPKSTWGALIKRHSLSCWLKLLFQLVSNLYHINKIDSNVQFGPVEFCWSRSQMKLISVLEANKEDNRREINTICVINSQEHKGASRNYIILLLDTSVLYLCFLSHPCNLDKGAFYFFTIGKEWFISGYISA